ncbi:MAG: Fe-S cluster assembly protein SufD [Bacteroidales bacterium]|nr:Fe-S cluster assembly protein SufD [Bacteroidales bacterium]
MSKASEQYLELYRAHRDAIDAHGAPAMNALRQGAAEALRRAGGFQEKGDEGYEKTSVDGMFAPDYGVNINRVDMPADVSASFRCGVPNLSTLLAVVVNDRFVPSSTLLKNIPEGLTVCSLAQACREMPDLVMKYYGQAADISDPSVALNTMFAQDGVFIHVGKGVRSERAVQLVDIFSSSTPLMAARRVLVAAEENSHVAILKCDHTQGDEARCMSSEVVEIFAARGARVEWYDIEESNASTSRRHQLFARQAEGSELHICGATLTNGTTRNDFRIDVDGEHAVTGLGAMAIGSGDQHIDNSSVIRHAADRGRSNQLLKYVLDDCATGAFEGSIEVCHGARFVEAYQSNRNILASKGARMHTKPQLLIYNDDVKCSHGATTGQLDQNALFYMRTRGIPEDEARRMLMQAFMVDVIDSITLEPLRDRLRHMVDRRFAGETAGCRDCKSSC